MIDLSWTVNQADKVDVRVRKEVQETYDALVRIPEGERTYETVLRPLARLYASFELESNMLALMPLLHPEESVRESCARVNGRLSGDLYNMYARRDLAEVYKGYREGAYERESAGLSQDERQFLDNVERDFRRMGAWLEPAQAEELRALRTELFGLMAEYRANLGLQGVPLELTEAELEGIPRMWDSFEALGGGRYRVPANGSTCFYLLQYVLDEGVRRRVWEARQNVHKAANAHLLHAALQKRRRMAELLGFESYAAFRNDVLSLGGEREVRAWLDDADVRLNDGRGEEVGAVMAFARSDESPAPLTKDGLDSWDMPLYRRAMSDKRLPIDAQTIRKYFPHRRVVAGALDVYCEMFGLTMSETSVRGAWHEDLEARIVCDAASGETLGTLLLDLHPRDGKSDAYGAYDVLSSCDYAAIGSDKPVRRDAVVLMTCSFWNDAQLSYYEVVDLFHELGHCMHALASRVSMPAFAALLTDRDLIEAPAIAMEYVCAHPTVMQRLSGHVETGEPLPKDMLAAVAMRKNMFAYLDIKWEVVLAYFDLDAHGPSVPVDEAQLLVDVMHRHTGYLQPVKGYQHCSFPHIMGGYGGYDAAYYGYVLSRAYAVHIFHTVFKDLSQPGALASAGLRFRHDYLARGCLLDGPELLKKLTGADLPPNWIYQLKGE